MRHLFNGIDVMAVLPPIWTAWAISIEGNSTLFTCQLKPLWIGVSVIYLKVEDSLLNKTLTALIADESLDWTEVSFRSLAKDTLCLFTQDKFIKCMRTIRTHICFRIKEINCIRQFLCLPCPM